VPTVRGELKLKGRVHEAEAKYARAHTKRKLKITLPGPMTIADTIADAYYGDKIKMEQLPLIMAADQQMAVQKAVPRQIIGRIDGAARHRKREHAFEDDACGRLETEAAAASGNDDLCRETSGPLGKIPRATR